MTKILITGATGSIGGAVARAWLKHGLQQPGDVQLRAFVRRPDGPEARALQQLGVEIATGDLEHPESIPPAVAGCNLILHAANDMEMKDVRVARRVGVDATRALAVAAAEVGVKRLIFTSSIAVYGGMDGVLNEERQPQPWGELYGDLKIEAERVLQAESHARGAPEVTILRFPAVYGPAQNGWTRQPLQQARQNRLVVPGRGDFPLPYLSEEGMIAAVTAASVAPHCGIYNIVEGTASYASFMGYYAAMTGARIHFIPLPLVMAFSLMNEALARLRGGYASISRKVIRRMFSLTPETTLPVDKARRELGWQPVLTLDEGMARVSQQLQAI